jgi:hypothetical protein
MLTDPEVIEEDKPWFFMKDQLIIMNRIPNMVLIGNYTIITQPFFSDPHPLFEGYLRFIP